MSTAFLIFVCTYGVVLALTVQHLNINGGQQLLAFITSVLIGVFNLVLLKLMPQPTSSAEVLAYVFGGPLGIVTAMRVHPWLIAWHQRRTGERK